MATKLFKLAIDAVTTTDTAINPAVESYFYELSEDQRTGGTVTIPATEFTDDAGNVMTGNLTPVTTDNGYYLLFINGVLQQTSLYTVSGDGSQVVITDADTVPVGAPITLVVTNFAPVSDSDTTVTT
ncbi:uncharacterized protein DUF4183 [Desulfitobacterium sp. LBE]|uniref:DUF4183 domain protein n=4 Tax=root TaxID=1 RepID=A0A098AWN7_DESHA|nr:MULTISPECIES: DUF4183 domain-containing protein [Desulfitobacterium]ACL20248.1 conserved hypothetical protein [Desulfitobacterium hafniense DCB-2]EHL05828.1 hypothetical protein HMPREF0322_03588 [Desulfitobacterium hafniense DP7]KTE90453.1 hypothetical protein AT727_07625 [Desulfitobacterium hafniense]MEA5021740.1 DUF4183 domain-containing protein [Desulfitobacterium hafniense]TWH56895.1 uncharacterized protein DUF4183 [Desulfitobacterium sp. LBE]